MNFSEIASALRERAGDAKYPTIEAQRKAAIRVNRNKPDAEEKIEFVFGTLKLRCLNNKESVLAMAAKFDKAKPLKNFQKHLDYRNKEWRRIPEVKASGGCVKFTDSALARAAREWDTEILDQAVETGQVLRYEHSDGRPFYIIGVKPLSCDDRFVSGQVFAKVLAKGKEKVKKLWTTVTHKDSGLALIINKGGKKVPVKDEKEFLALDGDTKERMEKAIANLSGRVKQ